MTSPAGGRRVEDRDGEVLGAWAAAVAIPTVVVVAVAVAASEARCEPDQVDCSWGFEYLLAVPVALAAGLLLAPLAVWWVLRRRGDPLAADTAWWCLLLGVVLLPTCIAALATPLAARRLALRRARRLDAPAEPSA